MSARDGANQCIQAGILDEVHTHLAAVQLNDGVRLFDHPGAGAIGLESTRVVETPNVLISGSAT